MSVTEQVFNNRDTMEVILSYLAPADMKAVALVSRSWRDVVEQARYWTWARTVLTTGNFEEMLSSQRFRNIPSVKLRLTDPEMKEDLFMWIKLQNSQLRSLTAVSGQLVCLGLHSVSPYFLARAAIRLEELDLSQVGLSADQVTQILWEIADQGEYTYVYPSNNPGLNLTKLSLAGNQLGFVSPELLGFAVLRLEEVNLAGTGLSGEQVRTLFSALAERETVKLRRLTISDNNLTFISPDILAQAAQKLELLKVVWSEELPVNQVVTPLNESKINYVYKFK